MSYYRLPSPPKSGFLSPTATGYMRGIYETQPINIFVAFTFAYLLL